MSTVIDDPDTLQARVGKLPVSRDLKVIDHLDANAQRWIAAAPFAFLSFGSAAALDLCGAGGASGFCVSVDAKTLRLVRADLDAPQLAQVGAGFGSLFLTPSLGETLRVNGRVLAVDDETITLRVNECYLHCAKALMRSQFWAATPSHDAPSAAEALLTASRFMALATVDAEGRADVSPKGDPAGALLQLHDGAAWYADRPGNRRIDSFRNILTQPRIALMAFVPGTTRLLHLRGRATISTDAAMCAAFTVGAREPKLVTRIDEPSLTIIDSTALRRAQLWPAAAADDTLDPAAIFAAHVRLSKTRGLQAGIARVAMSVPGLMEKGLQHDYKNNLY